MLSTCQQGVTGEFHLGKRAQRTYCTVLEKLRTVPGHVPHSEVRHLPPCTSCDQPIVEITDAHMMQ